MFWFILFWLACSVLTYGFSFAYWQRAFPTLAEEMYMNDLVFSLAISLAGPLGFIGTWLALSIHSDKVYHGFKFI